MKVVSSSASMPTIIYMRLKVYGEQSMECFRLKTFTRPSQSSGSENAHTDSINMLGDELNIV